MEVVTFCDIDKTLFDAKYDVQPFNSGFLGECDVAILDIASIFDFEENKHKACKNKFISIAIIDDESDYDAFKNFGIDAWIKQEDLPQINNLLNLVSKRCLS